MATDWAPEMQAQLDQFKQDLTEVIKIELRDSEKRLSGHIDEQLALRFLAADKRLSEHHQVSVEEVRAQVRLLGEAFGGALDSINRRIQALEENVSTTLKDHARILSTHSRQIEELNRRSGH